MGQLFALPAGLVTLGAIIPTTRVSHKRSIGCVGVEVGHAQVEGESARRLRLPYRCPIGVIGQNRAVESGTDDTEYRGPPNLPAAR